MSLDAVRLDELRRSLTDVERELGSLVAFVEAPSAAPASDVGGSLNQIAADLGETLQAVRTAMGALSWPVEPPPQEGLGASCSSTWHPTVLSRPPAPEWCAT